MPLDPPFSRLRHGASNSTCVRTSHSPEGPGLLTSTPKPPLAPTRQSLDDLLVASPVGGPGGASRRCHWQPLVKRPNGTQVEGCCRGSASCLPSRIPGSCDTTARTHGPQLPAICRPAPASHEQGTRSRVAASGPCVPPPALVPRPPQQRSLSLALPNALGLHLDVPRDHVTTQKAFPAPGGVAGLDSEICSLENSEG